MEAIYLTHSGDYITNNGRYFDNVIEANKYAKNNNIKYYYTVKVKECPYCNTRFLKGHKIDICPICRGKVI
jgi:thioredoxin-related protein